MATTIAVSGKGGSGKTTLAAMITRLLIEKAGKKSVIVVDADPNACLGLTLGVEPETTVADIREETRAKGAGNTGMDKIRSVEYGIQQAITEAKGFDLLTMGRPEGPSCYCAVNNMLRKFMDQLGSQYDFVIIDNEAGMEHLSRRTTNNVDVLFIVAEPNNIGCLTVQRISELSRKLPIDIKLKGVIWNRADIDKEIDGIDNFGHIPYDKSVFDTSMQDKTVFDLANDSPAFSEARKIFEDILVQSS
ncbi:MAG: AAA family ATPase [Planctomycetes bacterium]|nr:AAA family ATPase [Planctomycetota bacterium]